VGGSERGSLVTRLLGVGLAAALAAVTLVLAATGQIGLYINPESSWFAVAMAVLALVGAVVSFALPLGAEAEHGHDHGGAHGHDHGHEHRQDHGVSSRSARSTSGERGSSVARSTSGERGSRVALSTSGEGSDVERGPRARDETHRHGVSVGGVAAAAGGILATGIVAAIVLVPPATLSAELAMSRDTGTPPLFQGADTVALAATGDTGSFGIGEWASVFATATNPEAFDGDEVVLTGFVTPADADAGFQLTRLVITHCVIDAQPASIPIAADDIPDTGVWVTVTGTIRDVDGGLQVQAATVETVDQPDDPYEF